jgi:hypothetical protein
LPFHDNSFITHLATGRLILDGQFPREDVYSFTALGEPWVVQSWLASALYAGIERLVGSPGIHLLQVALCGALGAIIWTLTRPAETLIPRLIAASLAMGVATTFWSERPLMIGLLGMALVLLALQERVPPWTLIPIFWVWANSHGSFPLALVAIACVIVGGRLDGDDTVKEQRVLLFALAGSVAAVIGPLGIRVLTFPVEMLQRADLLQKIVEWKSPDFAAMSSRLFLVQVAVAILALVRRPSYRVGIPLVVFVCASLIAARNVTVASLVLVPGTAVGLAGLGSIKGDRRSVAAAAGVGVMGLLSALVTVAAVSGTGWSYELYPKAALAWGADQGMLEPDVRMLTTDYVGNLREGILGAPSGTFIDDRYDMYPAPVIEDYTTLLRLGPGWREILARYEFDVVVWPRDLPLSEALRSSEEWRIAYQDGDWLVAVPRTDPPAT